MNAVVLPTESWLSNHRSQRQAAIEVGFDPVEQAARNLVADHGDVFRRHSLWTRREMPVHIHVA